MTAVSRQLFETIQELQELKSLKQSFLIGGTSLAIRYNHRVSIDIDLAFDYAIGEKGLDNIENDISRTFSGNVMSFAINNKDLPEQYRFIRTLIYKTDAPIKVDILQNMQHLYDKENLKGIETLSSRDIGLMKLKSASGRFAKKDIYDLDYITDQIDIVDLYQDYLTKSKKYQSEKYHNLFDLDIDSDHSQDLTLLIAFDNNKGSHHSSDMIKEVKGQKTWGQARRSWVRKIRKLFNSLGKEFPKPSGIDI